MGAWRHDTVGLVALPDGRRLRGRGLRAGTPSGDVPEFGVYLLGRAPTDLPWPSRWIDWPDFRLPRDPRRAVAALGEAYERSATERVEIACGGGRGRTGTALAIVAQFGGVPPEEALGWVRANYHRRAVETPWQRRWIGRALLSG